ncbi:MAG: carboxynorspermidine decarboxylase [Defluviitaleaceae bacterium]|nr:carboxynorspermidine decarboxylase [Defluviitaleaceae bacterium]
MSTLYNDAKLQTPYFIVDEALLTHNLEILADVKRRADCKILLAQKAFSMYHFYPLISRYLDGTCASGLHEALLAHEHFKGENHVFSPAFTQKEMPQLLEICDHFVFNSFSQWQRFRGQMSGKSCGIRVNPEFSTQEGTIYNPCAPNSRLGVTLAEFRDDLLDGIDGLHFHTLCQQDAEDLLVTWEAFEAAFGRFIPRMKWLNFGGGHHITKKGYNIELLINLIKDIKSQYNVEIYLEPGEAIAIDTGFLVAEVVDILRNEMDIAILDTSAACHMPDVLEMPYRPYITDSGKAGEKPHTYRLGGPSCLAGDIIGDYSFEKPLNIGDRLIFTDMAIYSMVKTNTFNGIKLPDIAVRKIDGKIELVKQFGYQDFKARL